MYLLFFLADKFWLQLLSTCDKAFSFLKSRMQIVTCLKYLNDHQHMMKRWYKYYCANFSFWYSALRVWFLGVVSYGVTIIPVNVSKSKKCHFSKWAWFFLALYSITDTIFCFNTLKRPDKKMKNLSWIYSPAYLTLQTDRYNKHCCFQISKFHQWGCLFVLLSSLSD
jgi:hypothetical protein